MDSTKFDLKRPALYVVGTPIGNLADFSSRAQYVLSAVDFILAEDTRKSQHLLDRYGIKNKMIIYHDHLETSKSSAVIKRMLDDSAALALISDSGTPLISDPGYKLVKGVADVGIPLIPVPGPSALVACLSISDLPIDRFVFEGFLPSKEGHRLRRLAELKNESRSTVFYEAPHRIVSFLQGIEKVMGSDRRIIVARELTKMFETTYRGPVSDVLMKVQAASKNTKGEFTIIVAGSPGRAEELEMQIDAWLKVLLEEVDIKTAVKMVCRMTDFKRNMVYERALSLSGKIVFEKNKNKKQNNT